MFGLVGMLLIGAARPANAQRFVDITRAGPFAWLRGIVFRQAVGPLTGGDWVDLAPADWDGDGRMDLFTGSGYGDLLFFRQQSDGIFAAPSGLGSSETNPFAFDAVRSQACPETCDWDGDGDLDLLLAAGEKVFLYETRTAEGRSSFAPGVELQAEGAQPILPVADCSISAVTSRSGGRPDLFVSCPDGRLLLAKRQSDAILAPPGEILPAGDLPRARMDVADYDGDGIDDLIIGTGDGRAFLRLGQPGTDGRVFDVPVPIGGENGHIPGPDGTALRDLSPRCVDWERDGDIDIVFGTRSGRVLLLERTQSAQFAVRPYLQQINAPIDAGRCAAADIHDWDGDGREDLIVGGEDGLIRVYLNDGRAREGVFGPERLVRSGTGLYRRAGGYCRPAMLPRTGALSMVAVGGGTGDVRLLTRTDQGILHVDRVSAGGRPLALEGLSTVSVCDYDLDGDTDLFIGAREIPDRPLAGSQPIVYLENRADRAAPPRFNKAAQIELYTSGPRGDSPLQEAGTLRPNAVSVIEWTAGGNAEFIVTGAQGVDLFTTPTARNVYPTLFLAPGEGSRLLPPVYFARSTLFLGHTGILVGTEAYGVVCWYPRMAWEELDAAE